MNNLKTKVLTAALCSVLSLECYAAAVNPASTTYVTQAIQTAINAFSKTQTYKVGQVAQGGVIVYVDQTGKHGLVAALDDSATAVGLPYFNPSIFGSTLPLCQDSCRL